MSAIGPGSIGALNLAGSIAGVQRNNGDKDAAKAQAADKQFQIDQKTMSSKGMDDVAEADLNSDRDTDGREPYDDVPQHEERAEDESPSAGVRRPSLDADGERGASLDLQA